MATLAIQLFGNSFKKAEDKAKALQKRLEKLNASFSAELGINEQLIEQQELQGKETEKLKELRKDILRNQLKSVDALLLEQAELIKNQSILNNTVSNWEIILGAAKFLAAVPLPLIKKLWGDIETIQNKIADFELGLFGLKREDFTAFAATKKELEKQSNLEQQLKDITLQRENIKTKILAVDKEITKELKKQKNFYLAYSKGFASIPVGTFDVSPKSLEKLNDFVAQYGKALRNLRKENTKTIQAVEVFKSRLEEIFDNLELALAGKIGGGIANIIADFGDNIGQALATGGNLISAGAAGLISSFGGFLSGIGKLLIEYGTLGVGKGTLDTALSTLFGPALVGAGLAAIGVGLALTAVGGAFKTIGNKGLSDQGIQAGVSGSGSYGGSNTSYSGGGGGFGGGEVVFRIQGSSLVGVLNNTLNSNARLGGTLTVGNG